MDAIDQFVTRDECDGCKGAIARELGESHEHLDAMAERVAALDASVRLCIDRIAEFAAEVRNGLGSVRTELERERERAIISLERRISEHRTLGREGTERRIALRWKLAIGLVLGVGAAAAELGLRHLFGG